MKITEILNNHGMITYSYDENCMMRPGACPLGIKSWMIFYSSKAIKLKHIDLFPEI